MNAKCRKVESKLVVVEVGFCKLIVELEIWLVGWLDLEKLS